MKNNFVNLSLEELKIGEEKIFPEILKIRNENFVRMNMYNNKLISLEEHLNWIRTHLQNKTKRIFKIIFEEKLIGALITSNISLSKKESEWAFYLTKNSKTGLGAIVEYKFLDLFFKTYPEFELKCEVLEFNKSVISLHKKFGFEIIKTLKNRSSRDGVPLNSVLMKLIKSKWLVNKIIIEKNLRFNFLIKLLISPTVKKCLLFLLVYLKSLSQIFPFVPDVFFKYFF